MKIAELHLKLQQIYRIGKQPPVDQFLIDADEAKRLVPDGVFSGPQVLVRQETAGLSLAVHVGDELLKRIEKRGLRKISLAEFCGAAEEISHFTYLLWSACNDRKVSLLDIEMQGEIDKFLLASLYFGRDPLLFERLFERITIESTLSKELKDRYREANRFGGKFWRSLRKMKKSLSRLREFYRLNSPARLAWVQSL